MNGLKNYGSNTKQPVLGHNAQVGSKHPGPNNHYFSNFGSNTKQPILGNNAQVGSKHPYTTPNISEFWVDEPENYINRR